VLGRPAPQTSEPGRGFHGFDAPPEARLWFQYQSAGETARPPGPHPGAGGSSL